MFIEIFEITSEMGTASFPSLKIAFRVNPICHFYVSRVSKQSFQMGYGFQVYDTQSNHLYSALPG